MAPARIDRLPLARSPLGIGTSALADVRRNVRRRAHADTALLALQVTSDRMTRIGLVMRLRARREVV